jgi:GDP-L-fucose synthase
MNELPYSISGKRVWVAGERGMVGSAVVRRLSREGCTILSAHRNVLDLTRQTQVEEWMEKNRPEAVFVCAAKVGGIQANSTYPADFIRDNLSIELNVIEAARRFGVEKLLFLGSSCIYPREAPQPLTEEALLTGPLEPTNQWYAIAKIAGLKLCEAYRAQYGVDFISAMPTNLYGPHDNFDLMSSHVVPALLRKAHEAKRVGANAFEVWGSGSPMREFLHVDDLADALVFLMRNYSAAETVNVGTGTDVTIRELAEKIVRVVGFEGELVFDPSKPDGTPRKVLDMSKLHGMGWRHRIDLEKGLQSAYEWFVANHPAGSAAA